jgi:rhodanese-related sulfurtransferase
MPIHVPEVTVTEAAALLRGANPPRLIDVREQDEWDFCHVEGAEFFPLSRWPGAAAALLASTVPLLVICHHGGRSAKATQYLLQAGLTEVRNVAGGIDAWAVEIAPGMPRY